MTGILTNGAGGPFDWLALAAIGSPDTSYVTRVSPGAGVTTYAWPVVMPNLAGQYEFRLFDGNNARVTSSAPVTVALRPSAGPTLTVDTLSAAAGTPVTVTLTNGTGGATDWLALAVTGAPDASYVQFVWVGAGVTTRTWTVTLPTTSPATYEFRLFPNGGYTRSATSPTITATPPLGPMLSVSASSVTPGGSITVTLTGGLGGSTDWFAFAVKGAANSSYLKWVYVGAGVKSRSWTVAAPTTVGTYEFRLFLNGGFTLTATSPPVTVAP